MCRDANAYALASLRLQDSLSRVCFVLSRYLGSTKPGWDELLQMCRDANAYALASLRVRNSLSTTWDVLLRYLGRTKTSVGEVLQIYNYISAILGMQLLALADNLLQKLKGLQHF